MRAWPVLLLLLGTLSVPPGAACREEAAQVPCGYIYPRITLEGEEAGRPVLDRAGLVFPLRMVFAFDPMAEGLAAEDPQRPIVVTFEFPRRPAWVEMAVEPAEIPIPIQPQHFRPDPSDPQNPRLTYQFEAEIEVRVRLVGQAVLPDGLEAARLYVFAKSSESGLYKPGYGIREVEVVPAGAIHESDLGPREELTPVEAGPLPLRDLRLDLPGGARVDLDLPVSAELWRPVPVRVLAPGAERVQVALTDGAQHILASTPRLAPPFEFNVTFPRGGGYRFLVLAEGGEVGTAVGSAALDLPLPPSGSGWQLPRDYRLLVRGALGARAVNTVEPPAQDEHLIPFAVFEGARGADFAVQLVTDGAPVERGAMNLNVAVLDPQGAILQQGTVDFLNPVRRFPVGALPGPGLYHVRLFGAGAPGASYLLGVQVVYDARPVLAADSPWLQDAPRLGQHNVTLEVSPAGVWAPAPVAVRIERAGGQAASGAGSLVAAVIGPEGSAWGHTGRIEGALAGLQVLVTFPRAGTYTVAAFLASAPGSATQWGDAVALRTVTVGEVAPSAPYPVRYAAPFAAQLPAGSWGSLGAWRFSVFPEAGELTLRLAMDRPGELQVRVTDAAGQEVARREVGDHRGGTVTLALPVPPGEVVVSVRARAVAGAAAGGELGVEYPAPPSEGGAAPPAPPASVPAWPLAAAAALALAGARRR